MLTVFKSTPQANSCNVTLNPLPKAECGGEPSPVVSHHVRLATATACPTPARTRYSRVYSSPPTTNSYHLLTTQLLVPIQAVSAQHDRTLPVVPCPSYTIHLQRQCTTLVKALRHQVQTAQQRHARLVDDWPALKPFRHMQKHTQHGRPTHQCRYSCSSA